MDNCIVLRMAEGRSGTLTPSAYNKFLTNRARGLLFRDKKHKKPYAFTSSKAEYRSLIHDAVKRNGQTDPYTGDMNYPGVN